MRKPGKGREGESVSAMAWRKWRDGLVSPAGSGAVPQWGVTSTDRGGSRDRRVACVPPARGFRVDVGKRTRERRCPVPSASPREGGAGLVLPGGKERFYGRVPPKKMKIAIDIIKAWVYLIVRILIIYREGEGMDEKKLMEKFDRLNRKMRRCFAGYFADTPLTSIQGLTLHYIIVESEYRDVFPKDLEEFLEIKGSSVNSLINNLEKNGYVRRESISGDGRYKKLALTEKASAMGEDIVSRVTAYMKGIFVGIPEEELEVFQRVIEKMEENTGQ